MQRCHIYSTISYLILLDIVYGINEIYLKFKAEASGFLVAKSRKRPGSSKKKEVSNDVKDENVAVKSIVKTEKSVVKTEKSALKIKKTALRAKKSVMKTENSAVKTEKTVVKMEYEEIYEQMENKSKKSIFRAANRVSSGRTHIMTTRSQLFVGKLE